MRDGPRYPMPAVMRDQTEFELAEVKDRDLVYKVRQLVALAYAHGFEDGHVTAVLQQINDRNANLEEA